MGKVRVLVIDDSLTIRATLEEVLQKSEHVRVVGSAASVEEARQLIATLDPDVITLDLAMPGASGQSFLDERMGAHHAPSIVISSTGTDEKVRQDAIARGAAACFDKSRLVTDARKIVREIQLAALQHLRRRVAGMEREMRLSGTP